MVGDKSADAQVWKSSYNRWLFVSGDFFQNANDFAAIALCRIDVMRWHPCKYCYTCDAAGAFVAGKFLQATAIEYARPQRFVMHFRLFEIVKIDFNIFPVAGKSDSKRAVAGLDHHVG